MRSHQVDLSVTMRTETGKSAAKRLRAAGRIPAVIYGRGVDNLLVSVEAATFARALPETGWYSTLIQLEVEGAPRGAKEHPAMIVEVQRDPVWQRLLSIDFHRISLREKLHAQVPVIHVGQSPGVRVGGILQHITHEVTVECLPTDLPDHLEVDISGMEIGDVLRVSDLAAPEGATILSPRDEVVISLAPPVRLEEVAAAPAEVGAVVEEREEPEVIGEREQEEE